MSVPFSNTHLRVPRGFGNLLVGLAREILRDQPEDIPTFAALYFNDLLKKRADSGMDPAEWAARLEDRFYNNHSFKVNITRGALSNFGGNKPQKWQQPALVKRRLHLRPILPNRRSGDRVVSAKSMGP
uniref:Sperm autoantigenic protein 17 n=1 Tax=Paramormyrops kingsleyae TaxID=1676925 RepID=A0A3B3RRN8_9TELE